MTALPPELEQFAAFLDTQPGSVQTIFRCCLSLRMGEGRQDEVGG